MSTIGRRITATAEVPLRKVRAATVDALETLEQHTAVINGQGFKLKGLGERVADVITTCENLSGNHDALVRQVYMMREEETIRLKLLERNEIPRTFLGRLRWLIWGPK